MKSMLLKIIISLICIAAVVILFFYGESIISTDESTYIQRQDEYIDAFRFDPEELSYDGKGDFDLLEGVSLEGYTSQDLKKMVFSRIYAGDSLSEKIIQYTVETETEKIRSVRPLKLKNYTGPKIKIPNELPEVTRNVANHFSELLKTKSGYAVDDGFGNDVRDYAEISYEADGIESALLHYTVSFDNMFGDGDVEKVDVRLVAEPAYLTLTESEIVLQKGDTFEPADYVARAELADGTPALDEVMCSKNIDTSKAGSYEVKYGLLEIEMILYVTVE